MTSRCRAALTATIPRYFVRRWGMPESSQTVDPRVLALWRQLVALPKCEHATAEGQHGSPAYHALTAAIRVESDRFKQDTGDA